MIKLADIFTGTPCSFQPRAHLVHAEGYLSGQNHWSYWSTGGIELRWAKNPANVWYSAVIAERRIAMPPLLRRVPRRKF
jgi:hypothetical protein